MTVRRPSLAFLSAVAGACITGAGFNFRVEWPLWPVSRLLDVLRVSDPYGDAEGLSKFAIVAGLMLANSIAWATAVLLAVLVTRVARTIGKP